MLTAKNDPRADEHSFERRHRTEKLLALGLGAVAHDALDARTVVPAAIEEDDFASRRQVCDVTLEIPLRAFALARRRQRRHAAHARVQALRDALDDAPLPGGVAPFEDHDELALLVDDPILQLDELTLQPKELSKVLVALGGGGREVAAEAAYAVFVHRHLQLLVKAVLGLSL